MPQYNRFAGQSLDRLNGLSDGIFAVAMTLLVLDVRLPEPAQARTSDALVDVLAELRPQLLAYVLSFTMLGTFWLAQHTLLGLYDRADRNVAWLHLALLLAVTLLPFTTSVLADYLTTRTAIGIYWLNLLLLGLCLGASACYARRAGLVTGDDGPDRLRIFSRRILVAQVLYGVAALLCLVNTTASVVALVVVQAYFVTSPRLPVLERVLLHDRTPGRR